MRKAIDMNSYKCGSDVSGNTAGKGRYLNASEIEYTYSTVLLTEKEVARMFRVSLPTLRRWRHEGDGPPCLKLSSLCRYPLSQLEAWLAGLKCTSSVVQEES